MGQPQKSRGKLSYMFSTLTAAVRNAKKVGFWHSGVQVPDTGWDDQRCLKLLFYIHLSVSPLCTLWCFSSSTCIFFVSFSHPYHCCFSDFVNIPTVF